MTRADIEGALDRAEAAVGAGGGVRGTGFWSAVDAARRDTAVADRYAERIAAVDRRAFENGVKLRVPLWVGMSVLLAAALAGAGAVCVSILVWEGAVCFGESCPPEPAWASLVFLGGVAALVVSTHCPAHWVAGRIVGIRFTHVFLGGPPPPRPGLKTDYATYLRVPPGRRAFMHASGAVVTKVIPFAFLAPAVLYLGWGWVALVLVAFGVVQIATDIILSTKVSDWKKVGRELDAARAGR